MLKSSTRAALLGTTALVVSASGAQAIDYVVNATETSTFVLGLGTSDTLTINGSGEINSVSPGVAVIDLADSITISDTGAGGSEIDADAVGIDVQGIGSDLTGGITIASGAVVTATTTGGTAGTGILVRTGADVSGGINNSGAITGYDMGVGVRGSASISGGIANTGTIFGRAAAIIVGSSTTDSSTMGAINNSGSGVIGVNGANDTVAARGILVGGTGSDIAGLITNSAGATIVGTQAAIHVVSAGDISGGITNAGMIGNVSAGTSVTASVAIAVTSGGNISGTITNSGTIVGDTAAILVNSGAISGGIVNSGDILSGGGATDAAINVNAGTLGSTANIGIVNQLGGVISGNSAIVLENSSIVYGITNSGEIYTTGTSAAAIAANSSQFNGDVVNTSTGVIGSDISGEDADEAGIAFVDTDSTGGITNSGAITGTEAGIILLSSSDLAGAITNNALATIGSFTGTSTGVSPTTGIRVAESSSVAGGIINSGSIIGTASGILLGEDSSVGTAATSSAAAVSGIVNNASGLISGGSTGINIDKSVVLGGISNSGDIEGTTYGINLHNDGFGLGPTVVASITNASGGEIKSNNTAVFVDFGATISGALTNAGTIGNVATGGATSGRRGIHVNGSGADIAGGVNNSGTIKGTNAAIEVASNGAISGGITNSGAIGSNLSNDGIHVNGGSVGTSSAAFGISNTGTGTILGSNAGILVSAGGSVLSDIENAGAIYGVDFGIAVTSGGTVNGITNSGLIGGHSGSYADTAALLVSGASSNISGVVTNTGTLRADIDAIRLVSGGSITGGIANGVSGTLMGYTGDGISIGAGSVVGSVAGIGITNATSADIRGVVHAIDIAGSVLGGISNDGIITGQANGINITTVGSVTGGIENLANGRIEGDTRAINVSGSVAGGITNSGSIQSESADAIRVHGASGSVTGGIVNNVSAVISASSSSGAGIAITGGASVTGGISNSGTIYSDHGFGILIDTSSLTGDITNASGADITGDTVAIYVTASTLTGSIVNTGSISGTGTTGIRLDNGATITGTITNNSGGMVYGDEYAIRVDSGSDVTGGIVNAGQILTDTSSGTGILVTGASTVGSITNSGLIQGGTDTSGYGVYVSAGSSVGSITNSGTIEGDDGSVQFGNSDSTLTLQTGSNLIGDADGGTGTNDTLVLEGYGSENEVFTNFEHVTVSASTSGTWVLSGDSGFEDVTVNSGTLLITGNVTATSAMAVAGADLDVEGTLDLGSGTLTVNGIVDGSGTISGAVTINGILSPGNSPGVLTIGGPLLQTTGSTYIVEHDANHVGVTQTDRTDVTAGTATIQTGVTVQLDVAAGTDGFADDILTATGGVFGTYDGLVINDDNLVALIVYPDANTVSIIAAKTDALVATVGTVSDAGFTFLDNLQEGARRDGRVWATGYIYNAENEGQGTSGADYDQDAFGFNAGVDVISQPNLKVGLAVGYIDGDIDIDSATSDADNDGIFGAAYLNYMNDNFYLDGALMIGQQTVDTTRTLTAGDATASIDATSYGANLEAGFELEALGGRLSPFVKVGIHSASLDAYSESGAAGAMTVGEVETQQMRVGGGFRYAVDLGSADGIQVTPAIKVGMTQEWQEGDSSADIGFVGYTGSTSASLDFEDQTTVDLGISFDVKLSQAVTAFVGWDAALGDETTRNTGTIGLSVNW